MTAASPSGAGVLARVRSIDRALLLLAAMAFVVQVGVAVMLPLLPLFALSLGATPFVLGLLTSAFAITNAAGQLATGFLAERFPVRRLLAGGIGSYAVANLLIAGSGTAGLLVLFRSMAGFGGGTMLVGERLYLTQISDPTRLAFANGILSAAGSAGMVAGPAIGGVLAALSDLRAPFLLVGVTSLVATAGALFLPRPVGETAAQRRALEADAATERRPAPKDTRRRLAVLLASQLAFQASFGAFITTYAPFATERLGWTTAEVGIVFAMFGVGAIVLGPWLSRLADVHGRRNIAVLATIPVALFAIVYVAELPRLVLYPVTIVAGGGVTAMTASWYALLADATEGGRKGRVFGAIAAFANLGIVVGATVAAQAWERTGDVGLGLLAATVTVGLAALALLAHPAERRG